jgi:hypothetical protein
LAEVQDPGDSAQNGPTSVLNSRDKGLIGGASV